MSITLADNTTSLTLNPDLFWEDELRWNPVQQSREVTLTGAQIFQAGALTAGRPITLTPSDDTSCWTPRSQVEQLRNLAAVPGKQMTLTLRGVSRTVIFRHHDGVAVEASPVVHYSDVAADDWYLVTLRFTEV